MSIKHHMPAILPPIVDYRGLISQIGNARGSLGRLTGSLMNIQNPDLLTTPLLTKEAVLSSKIEGTQATLEEVFFYEAQRRRTERDERERDIREITNYRKAIHTAMAELKGNHISEELIKQMHSILMDSVRGSDKERGNFRNLQVYIGTPGRPIEEATYIPPPAREILPLIGNWVKYVNDYDDVDPLVQAGIAHYQFEAIHPFLDGNGRIGRLLIPLILYRKGLIPYPMFYISQYFEKFRSDYYQHLNRVSAENDWQGWLRFFLHAVEIQSQDTEQTIFRINALYGELKSRLSDIQSRYAINMLDLIFSSPIISYQLANEAIRASIQTIYNVLEKFVKLRIIIPVRKSKRNQLYVFQELLDILR